LKRFSEQIIQNHITAPTQHDFSTANAQQLYTASANCKDAMVKAISGHTAPLSNGHTLLASLAAIPAHI